MINLTYAGNTVVLPDDLEWTDEFAWHPVEQSKAYTTTGALILDVGTRQAGRPITLQGDETTAWLPRSVCDQISAWCAIAGIELTLELRGVVRSVAFDHERGAFEARPVVVFANADVAAGDWYVPTLRLIEI